MPKVKSREYKVMLHPGPFAEPEAACENFWNELQDLADSLGIEPNGTFGLDKDRRVFFLDTVDFTMRRNSVVMRLRQTDSKFEYTAKVRSPDRYIAGRNLQAAAEAKKPKFEEDIAAPFRGRFSHSAKIKTPLSKPLPETLESATELYGVFGTLQHDELPCPPNTRLLRVNGSTFRERVYTGAEFVVAGKKTELAVILWSSRHQDRPVLAEFSFRYEDENEKYELNLAALAKRLFDKVQDLDWCNPNGATKTQYVYGEVSG